MAGVNRRVTTNSFGYYQFGNVNTGETYVIDVISKRYRYTSRVLQIFDSLADVDFIGRE